MNTVNGLARVVIPVAQRIEKIIVGSRSNHVNTNARVAIDPKMSK